MQNDIVSLHKGTNEVNTLLNEIFATCLFRDFYVRIFRNTIKCREILRKFYILHHFKFAFLSTTRSP